MPDVKISDMTPGAALDGSELFEMTQAAGTVSTTADAIKTFVIGAGDYVQAVRVVTAAGAVTVTTADGVVVINKTVGAATTVNLPAGAAGLTFTIKDGKGDAGANNITIDGNAAETLDGAATYVMTTNYQSATIVFNGTQWNLI